MLSDEGATGRGGLCLYEDGGRLVAQAQSGFIPGFKARGEVGCRQEGFIAHFLFVPFVHDLPELPAVSIPKAWKLVGLAESAMWAAELNDWGVTGAHLDAIWAEDRADLPPNPKLDLAYSAARLAGAYGGRPVAGGFALLVPPNKHEAVRRALQ